MKISVFRRRLLPVLLAVSLLLLLGACGPRVLYTDRSIPALVGWPDGESYIQALRQTPLGVFGLTWQELAEAGYLTEGEGTWTADEPGKQVYTVSRRLAGGDCRTHYVFRTTLYTEQEGKLVLTDIRAEYAVSDEDEDSTQIRSRIQLQGLEMLEGWTVLNDCFAVYAGRYTHPLVAGEEECWEFLDWTGRPDDLTDINDAIERGWKQSYQVRCSPVTLRDVLMPEELMALADMAVEKGWAREENALRLMGDWHLAAMLMKNPTGHWDYSGMGIALYLTRPGAKSELTPSAS